MVNWSTLDTVFLDMDGTLLDLHFDNHFWLEHLPLRYAQKNNLQPQVAKQQLMALLMAQSGSLNWSIQPARTRRVYGDCHQLPSRPPGHET